MFVLELTALLVVMLAVRWSEPTEVPARIQTPTMTFTHFGG